jgi:hypothetical protein
MKHGVPQGTILHTLFYSTHKRYIKYINEKSKPVLFAVDTNVILINSNF